MDTFSMEPMLPEEAAHGLEDGAVALIAEANRLAGRVHPVLQQSVGELVRSMTSSKGTTLIRATSRAPLPMISQVSPNSAISSRKRWRTYTSSG